jgi:hypothetical protein
MSYSIHKQVLSNRKIYLSYGSKLLDVQYQNGDLTLWYLTPLSAISDEDVYEFHTFGTGWTISDGQVNSLTYFKTIQDGTFVWHIFYRKL